MSAALEGVLAAERLASALRLAKVRLALSTTACGLVWLLPVDPQQVGTLGPTRWGALAFVVISAGVLVGLRRAPRFGRWAGLTVPLLDMPLLCAIQHLQLGTLVERWHGIPTSVAMMLFLVGLSALSLSRGVVWVAAVVADVGIVSVLLRTELPNIPVVLAALIPPALGAVLSAVVQRIRALLHEARAKDLLGKYVLGDRIGSGGMAEVFLATYSPEGGFERTVAVKRILPSVANDPEAVALFRREAAVGAMLAHPNVVQVLDFGADGRTFFLAMEYVDGLPLSQLLSWCRRARAPLSLPAVVHVASMLGRAADYVHTRRTPAGAPLDLVHRDLNPPNVIVSRIGEVKLGDFGIARTATFDQLTAAGMVRGKLSYSAPEQLRGAPYDARADLFALGVTLFETLTARRLFGAADDGALLPDCLSGDVPPPSALRPEVPAALDSLVLGLLARKPEERVGTASEVLQALSALTPELRDWRLGQQHLADAVAVARADAADALARADLATRTASVPIATPR
ncbi:MAG: serine/threonine protein kinase [Myxococcaceae bacterium]|nr:serine/threonine protein kinase [Myxococcaceae bacterium]